MVLFFLMQILTCAVLLIIHPFKSAQVVSFMVDCVIRIVTCPLFVRLITQRLWKRHLYVCDISCVRFMQSLEEGKERMLPYFKVDCFCLLPCMVSVKGLEFQFQLHFLVAARDEETHSITLSIHLKIRKLRLEFIVSFLRLWNFFYTFLCQYLLANYKKFTTGTHSRNNHNSESNLNVSNCFGTDGYNFFSIFIDGITTMMHFQVNQSGAVGSTKELQDTYRKDSLPLVEVSKKPKKESQSKKEAMPPLLFFFSHLLKQVTITNMNLNIIGSLHKKDHRNTSNYVEYHSGISIGLKKIGVVSTTDNASPTATSCLVFQALSTVIRCYASEGERWRHDGFHLWYK